MLSNYLKFDIFLFFVILLSINNSIVQSTDWETFNEGLWGGNIQTITIDPDDPRLIYIGAIGGGFYYSEDGGDNWNQNNKDLGCWNILSLLVKKYNGNKNIYAGTENGIFHLGHRDSSWEQLHGDYFSGHHINLLVNFDGDDHEAFYAGSGKESEENKYKGLWIVEKGEVPEQVPFDFLTKSNEDSTLNVFDLIPFKNVKAAPNITKFHVATEIGFFKFYSLHNSSLELAGEPIFSLAERPQNGTKIFDIYAGTVLCGKKSENDGDDWWPHSYFLENEKVSKLEPSFSKNLIGCYAATYPSIICVKTENSENWSKPKKTDLPNLVVNTIAPDTTDLKISFAGSRIGIYKSMNWGTDWISKNQNLESLQRIHDIKYIKFSSFRKLVSASDGSLWFFNIDVEKWEKDPTWAAFNNSCDPIRSNITCFQIAKNNDEYMYLVGTDKESLFRKSDYSSKWKKINLDASYITSIAINPKNFPRTYVGSKSNGLYEIANFNEEATQILTDQHITDIAFDKENRDTIYFITLNSGLYQYNSGTEECQNIWRPQGLQLFTLQSHKQSEDNMLFIGTNNGIYYRNNIENPFEKYQYADILRAKKVMDLKILKSIDLYDGVLYALCPDSINQKTILFRSLINENINESKHFLQDNKYQLGECLSVDSLFPNTVYIGTSGTGVMKYIFDKFIPNIDTASLSIGNVPKWEEDTLIVNIPNENNLPLIVRANLSNSKDFYIENKLDTLIAPNDTH
ncbi:MAG: hypothetical protein GF329_10460, partial [Candidatus Lokiarchaeota archaeon]|nr:hypothetical protein [Candidatus Lokiarchaeota archaeon]